MEEGIAAIGTVVGGRRDRRDDDWDREIATIVLDDRFPAEALTGLDGFSHAEIVFRFDRLSDDDVTTVARRPRGNSDWPQVGIFAQRASRRPNRLGVTICRLIGVEGRQIRVGGLDAIDGTPVLDIKPVVRQFLPREEVVQPTWMDELMAAYWG